MIAENKNGYRCMVTHPQEVEYKGSWTQAMTPSLSGDISKCGITKGLESICMLGLALSLTAADEASYRVQTLRLMLDCSVTPITQPNARHMRDTGISSL